MEAVLPEQVFVRAEVRPFGLAETGRLIDRPSDSV